MKLKETVAICGTILQMQATTAALWFLSDWSIGKVMFGAILITAIGQGAWHVGRCMARDYIKRSRQHVRQLPERRRFQVFDLAGELIEVPISGTDMVEIRNVVAGSKRNILQSGRTMQDVG